MSFLWHFPLRRRTRPLAGALPCGVRTFLRIAPAIAQRTRKNLWCLFNIVGTNSPYQAGLTHNPECHAVLVRYPRFPHPFPAFQLLDSQTGMTEVLCEAVKGKIGALLNGIRQPRVVVKCLPRELKFHDVNDAILTLSSET